MGKPRPKVSRPALPWAILYTRDNAIVARFEEDGVARYVCGLLKQHVFTNGCRVVYDRKGGRDGKAK